MADRSWKPYDRQRRTNIGEGTLCRSLPICRNQACRRVYPQHHANGVWCNHQSRRNKGWIVYRLSRQLSYGKGIRYRATAWRRCIWLYKMGDTPILIAELTTDSSGWIGLGGLSPGSYKLVETKSSWRTGFGRRPIFFSITDSYAGAFSDTGLTEVYQPPV